jgi:hypothetical protein
MKRLSEDTERRYKKFEYLLIKLDYPAKEYLSTCRRSFEYPGRENMRYPAIKR